MGAQRITSPPVAGLELFVMLDSGLTLGAHSFPDAADMAAGMRYRQFESQTVKSPTLQPGAYWNFRPEYGMPGAKGVSC